MVRDRDEPESPGDVPVGVPAGASNVPVDSDLNPRQLWVLDQLRLGIDIRRVMVEKEFDVGEKTAKRDLSELVHREMIEYRRKGRDGAYRLATEVGVPH